MPNGSKIIVTPAAKLGHSCPTCGLGQLYQSDAGLACPNCQTVFAANAPTGRRAGKSKPEEE